MAQAKTLTKEEMTRVLDYINTRRFGQRNRASFVALYAKAIRMYALKRGSTTQMCLLL